MNPDELRSNLEKRHGSNLILFESLGWEYIEPRTKTDVFVCRPENLPRWRRSRHLVYSDAIPPYSTSLVDARTAWSEIARRKKRAACGRPYSFVLLENLFRAVYHAEPPSSFDHKAAFALVGASPAHFVEACLRTLGLWATTQS